MLSCVEVHCSVTASSFSHCDHLAFCPAARLPRQKCQLSHLMSCKDDGCYICGPVKVFIAASKRDCVDEQNDPPVPQVSVLVEWLLSW